MKKLIYYDVEGDDALFNRHYPSVNKVTEEKC